MVLEPSSAVAFAIRELLVDTQVLSGLILAVTSHQALLLSCWVVVFQGFLCCDAWRVNTFDLWRKSLNFLISINGHQIDNRNNDQQDKRNYRWEQDPEESFEFASAQILPKDEGRVFCFINMGQFSFEVKVLILLFVAAASAWEFREFVALVGGFKARFSIHRSEDHKSTVYSSLLGLIERDISIFLLVDLLLDGILFLFEFFLFSKRVGVAHPVHRELTLGH